MNNVNLSSANLSNTQLYTTDFNNVTMNVSTNLENTNLYETNFRKCNLEGIKLGNKALYKNLTYDQLKLEDGKNILDTAINFYECNMKYSDFSYDKQIDTPDKETKFKIFNSDLSFSDFSYSKQNFIYLENNKFTHANFTNATFGQGFNDAELVAPIINNPIIYPAIFESKYLKYDVNFDTKEAIKEGTNFLGGLSCYAINGAITGKIEGNDFTTAIFDNSVIYGFVLKRNIWYNPTIKNEGIRMINSMIYDWESYFKDVDFHNSIILKSFIYDVDLSGIAYDNLIIKNSYFNNSHFQSKPNILNFRFDNNGVFVAGSF